MCQHPKIMSTKLNYVNLVFPFKQALTYSVVVIKRLTIQNKIIKTVQRSHQGEKIPQLHFHICHTFSHLLTFTHCFDIFAHTTCSHLHICTSSSFYLSRLPRSGYTSLHLFLHVPLHNKYNHRPLFTDPH